ncbi:hydrogenase expression/formation protein HypC [Desulfoprunum benzoelyticum]|jgi:hydrogenase expression/formation protein HypC|uniref:Hydrogenase expression/formation protein HypC n=1 Tax=Desulfoprunum benzoelyticum TaxID=1506996 RepID=A0A840UTN0_9BACT|nr:HypC/HybG/HupF family hydrogenase formation chaperone [Desulfoprunum benzoelyticum]MBB5348113.1 hydrogenase expression/formation protein HypC [Desulfoprunum benzoelyticum]
MRVTEVHGSPEDFTTSQIAIVDADGISREVRLDVVDHWPSVGDYVIVHAGFAIHSLIEAEALKNLSLLKELAAQMPEELLS